MLTWRAETRGQHFNACWRWLPLMEASGVFLLIMGYIWWGQFQYRPAVLALLAFVVGSHVHRKETPADLGFRLTNLQRCVRDFGLPVLALALVLLTLGGVFGTIRSISLSRALLIVALYSVWGLFQQYVLNAYFVNRFVAASGGVASGWVPTLAAAFFASTHLPNWFLVSVTCVAGYLSAKIYLKYRNLYFLGIAHGLVGALLYAVVPDSISHKLQVGPLMAARPTLQALPPTPRPPVRVSPPPQ